jgi:hypothetical protein
MTMNATGSVRCLPWPRISVGIDDALRGRRIVSDPVQDISVASATIRDQSRPACVDETEGDAADEDDADPNRIGEKPVADQERRRVTPRPIMLPTDRSNADRSAWVWAIAATMRSARMRICSML